MNEGILGQIANPMIADVAGALDYRRAQMDKDEAKRKEITRNKLIAQAIPNMAEDSPIRKLFEEDPQAGAMVSKMVGIPLNDGEAWEKFRGQVRDLSSLADTDPRMAIDRARQMQAENQKLGIQNSQVDKWLAPIDAAMNNQDPAAAEQSHNAIVTQFNALHVMDQHLNPAKPDYEMMRIKNDQAKIDQSERFKSADLSIEQQKLSLERDKSKQADTGVTYQQDENGNFVALPTKMSAGGVPVSMPVLDAQGQPIKGKGQPLTESQSNAALFAARAKESQKIINDIGTDYSVPGLNAKRAVEWLPGIGAAANSMLSDNQQSVEQAQRDFVNAVLRKESGASISPQEFQNAQKQYFPQTGDSKTTIEQKNSNRNTAIAGLEVASGNGAKMVAAKQKETNSDAPKKSLTYNPKTGKFE